MLGIIGGSGLLKTSIFTSFDTLTIPTKHGKVEYHKGTLNNQPVIFIQRHHADPDIAYSQPHMINFRAIISAFELLNVKIVIGVASVGSCNVSIKVGSVVVPDDFVSHYNVIHMNDDYSAHIVPEFNPAVRNEILTSLHLAKVYPHDGGVYVQTKGPRFETKAEVRILSGFGDFIGMTCASEATIAMEAGIKYAIFGFIDNWANGMEPVQLTLEGFKEAQAKHKDDLENVCLSVFNYMVTTGLSNLNGNSVLAKPKDDKVAIDLLISSKYIIPVKPEGVVLENHCICVKDGKIVDIMPYNLGIEKYNAVQVKHYEDQVLIPGLINTHTHSPMVLMRGFGDDMELFSWLTTRIWPAEGANVNEEFVRDGCRHAIAEMIRSGTTCFNDMYFYPEVIADVVLESGMRASIGFPILDFPNSYASTPDVCLTKARTAISDWSKKDDKNEQVRFTICPHAPYTVCDENYLKCQALAREHNLKLHTHLHETISEVDDSRNGKKDSMVCHRSDSICSPLQNLDKLGLLCNNMIAAHMVHLNTLEITRIAELKVNIAHCPSSNLKLASGFCEVGQLLKAGVNVTIGTDGASSNNTLDMIGEMRLAALLAKGLSKDATTCPASTALKMATYNGAEALGISSITGSLEVGKYADIVAINLDEVEMMPLFDVASHVVYANSRDKVSNVWVAGQHLLRDRVLHAKGINEKEIKEKSKIWKNKILSSLSISK